MQQHPWHAHLAAVVHDLPAGDGRVVADLLRPHARAPLVHRLIGLAQDWVEGLQGRGLPPQAAHHEAHLRACRSDIDSANGLRSI